MHPHVDTVIVRLRVNEGPYLGQGDVVFEKTVELDIHGDLSADDAYRVALDFTEEHLGPDTPHSINVTIGRFSQGADGQVLSFVLDTLEGFRDFAWEALAAMFADYVAKRLKAGKDDEDKE